LQGGRKIKKGGSRAWKVGEGNTRLERNTGWSEGVKEGHERLKRDIIGKGGNTVNVEG